MPKGRLLIVISVATCLVVVLAVLSFQQQYWGGDDAEGLALGSDPAAASRGAEPGAKAVALPSATSTVEPGSAILDSIAGAQAEAKLWPEAEPPGNPSADFPAPAGSAERVCVDVQPGLSENGAWRSGEFIAGNFDYYIQERSNNPDYSKLWWKPLHNGPEHLVGVTVRATRLDGSGAASQEVFTFDNPAWPAPPPDVTPTPLPPGQHPDYFYPSDLDLPTAGRWMLVATMGPDWGCFVINLTG